MTFLIDTILQVIYLTDLLRFSRDAQLDLFVTGEVAIEVRTVTIHQITYFLGFL